VDEGAAAAASTELAEDLFRREYAHLVSALTRVLGPSNIPLAEDVVHDALVSAMHAWRFGLPRDPKAWIIRAAHNRAVDIIRREQRHRSFLPELATTTALTDTIESALAPAAEGASQLAMMFAVCDPGLNRETHVTLILRWLCGLSPREISQAFLADIQTIDRRLHRGRGRLRQLGRLPDVDDLPDVDTRRDSVLRSLYLLFNEGYHGSNPQDPVRPVSVRGRAASDRAVAGRQADDASGRARHGSLVLLRRRPSAGPPRRARRVRLARGPGPEPLGPGAHRARSDAPRPFGHRGSHVPLASGTPV